MSLLVLQAGLFDTIQDLGRTGYRRYGVTISGALDGYALRAANLLAGNPEDAAALEMTLLGPRLRFERETVAALAGADLDARLDGRPLPGWRAFAAPAGAELAFGGRRSGCRAYLAVAGGFDVPAVLGSRSTWVSAGLGGLEGRALRAGDRLPTGEPRGDSLRQARHSLASRRLPGSCVPRYPDEVTLRVLPGPQADYFTEDALRTFYGTAWTVTDRSDRMGCRLGGPTLSHAGPAEIISDGIAPGSIQVPADGQPIAILLDGQTTGGYPKIATIISADIARLAQVAPGGRVRFAAATFEAARAAIRATVGELRAVAWAAWRQPATLGVSESN